MSFLSIWQGLQLQGFTTSGMQRGKFGQLTFMWLWKLGVARCLEDITDGRIECVGQTTLARKESGPAQFSKFQHL